MIAHSEAYAAECSPPTPACHLANGRQLLTSNPKRAADELLASYKLDERTDTLELYAKALQSGGRYASAIEAWQRVVVYRESELDAAKDAARKANGSKLAAAKSAVTRARQQSDMAAEAIIQLWPKVGRVRVKFAPGQQLTVTRDGMEVDSSRDILVNAAGDELVFVGKDGGTNSVAITVKAGDFKIIDAPTTTVAAKPKAKKLESTKPAMIEQPKKLEKPAPKIEEEETEQAAMPSLTTTRLVEEPRSRRLTRLGLGLAAGAVIAGGIAGGLGYLADRDYNRARDAGCNADDQCPFGPAADLAQRSNDRARLAQISGVAGGALLVTGAVLWFYGRHKTVRKVSDVTVSVGTSSAAFGWRF